MEQTAVVPGSPPASTEEWKKHSDEICGILYDFIRERALAHGVGREHLVRWIIIAMTWVEQYGIEAAAVALEKTGQLPSDIGKMLPAKARTEFWDLVCNLSSKERLHCYLFCRTLGFECPPAWWVRAPWEEGDVGAEEYSGNYKQDSHKWVRERYEELEHGLQEETGTDKDSLREMSEHVREFLRSTVSAGPETEAIPSPPSPPSSSSVAQPTHAPSP